MGLFNKFKNTLRNSQAAVIIQNQLENLSTSGIFNDANPAIVANQLVSAVCNAQPDLFDGSFGQRAHKITVAAAALSLAIEEKHDNHRISYMYSLHNIMSEVTVNGRLYPLNSLDYQILETLMEAFSELAQEMEDDLPEQFEYLNISTKEK